MRQHWIAVAGLSWILCVAAVRADELGPRYVHASYGIRRVQPPGEALRSLASVEPEVVLPAPRAIADASNPRTVGTVRTLIETKGLTGAARSFRSTGAVRIRLYLTNVVLPPGSVTWVVGEAGDAVPFGAELLLNGTLWTPSVAGDTIRILLPPGARADVSAIVHQSRDVATNGVECFKDASCGTFDTGESSDSTAAIFYVEDGNLTYCSGGLINSTVDDRLFLTANHCLNTQAEAASVEAYWDLRTTSCNGPNATFQRTNGASLLVTSPDTDVTLLRLNSLPGGRWLLGWSAAVVEPGTLLYRVSHPQDPVSREPFRQRYNVTRATTSFQACTERPMSRYIYSTRVEGSTGDGSSGSPVTKQGGYIVGQLWGWCGFSGGVPCAEDLDVDGSLRASYPLLQPFLKPGSASACTPNSTTVCLLQNRFLVRVNYRNQFANPPSPGDFVAGRLNASAVNPDIGIFGLSDPQATEVMVRIADARPFAPRFDVYYGGLTDLEYWINVTDTVSGTTRSYYNAPGKLSSGLDRGSFPAN
jgi:hypothetical protein